MKNWKRSAGRYLLLFLFGYCIYLAMEVTVRGFSFRLMGLAGGASVAFLGCMLRHGLAKYQLPLQMLAGAGLITLLELFSGRIATKLLKIRMWDYGEEWLNLCDGLICPRFCLLWFALSAAAILLIGAVDYYVLREIERPEYRVFKARFCLPARRR